MTIKSKHCSLCSKTDILYNYEFTTKEIQNAFFSVNKSSFLKDLVKDLQLCVICAYKIQLSAVIKKDYDEMCNRNNRLDPTKCFFCEKKQHLISLKENPINTDDKLVVFQSSVIVKHNCKNLMACLKCLYNLDIWFGMRNCVYKIMNIHTSNSVINDDTANNIKSFVAPRSPQGNKFQNAKSWHKYLDERLMNFKTIDELLTTGDLTVTLPEESVLSDKLFNTLPFVEITTNSQINKNKMITQPVILETITLSDNSGSNFVTGKQNITRKWLNLSLKKQNNTKNTPKRLTKKRSTPKKKFRIRVKPFLSKKSANLSSLDSSSYTSVEIVNEISSENEEFLCNVCDKNFTVKCEFLLHTLKHEKLENLVVFVPRKELLEAI